MKIIQHPAETPPHPTTLWLTCDGGHERDLFGRSSAMFKDDGFMRQYRAAMRVGWKDTFKDGHRVFFGPCCSGKA